MIPVLPLRDVVVYPHMVIPLFVGRERSIQALERAMEQDKRILLVAQKDAAQDDPEIDEAPESAHVKRTAQESFDPEAFILRASMPSSKRKFRTDAARASDRLML